jgi:hypothetical protein
MENIYRHPQRQGLQLEKRYHMGHDIYSLGVCLLELGLWESLIKTANEGEDTLCEAYRDMAVRLQCVEPGDAVTIRKLTKPTVVQKVMGLAERQLPERMGLEYSQAVLNCLQCVEAGLGGLTDYRDDGVAVGLKFNEVILEPLSTLLVQQI